MQEVRFKTQTLTGNDAAAYIAYEYGNSYFDV